VRLADIIGRWIGKVEIVLAGAEDDRREGEEALASGDAMRARAAAHRVLERAPESPLGLALLADACELGHLEAELAMTLEQLAERAPSRAEVWVRLARARLATGSNPGEVRDAFLRGLAMADPGSEARRDALLGLTDLDLAQGEGGRAELWLERAAADTTVEFAVRRAEARLLLGDAAGAAKRLENAAAPATDGRAALARGRALAAMGDPGAFGSLVRAMVLDVPGASEALSSALAILPTDSGTRTRLRSVVDAKGEQDQPRWRAAFARAEGARDAARRALRDAVEGGDRSSALPLFEAAIEDRDPQSLDSALAMLGGNADPLVADARHLAIAVGAGEARRAQLDALQHVSQPRLAAWADARAAELARQWIPPDGPAAWSDLLARLDEEAHAAGEWGLAARLGDLAAERSRPLRLAVVGEFNAGKSTFINALIGADIAPTGVLPTTATLHHLRWGPDSFAKILFVPGHEPAERIVALADLRPTLRTLDPEGLARVEIRMPLSALVQVEILDTPGFNAPDPRHTESARAAFNEADIAIWLFDATQAMKQTERAVLEEAQRAKVPLQMLLNKADRLGPEAMTRVMVAVTQALSETRIESWGPPLALSAKLALAGKLGDPAALASSGWPAVERLLGEQIVDRSAALKERAVRRRAARLVTELTAKWDERAAAEALAQAESGARARRKAQAAAGIERDSDDLAKRLARSMTPFGKAWAHDANLVFVGRDPTAASSDPLLARYRVDRALSLLATPLAAELASLAPEVGLSPAQLAPTARAILRAATWGRENDAEGLIVAASRAALSTLVEQLFAASQLTPETKGAAGVVRELRALASALDRPPGDSVAAAKPNEAPSSSGPPPNAVASLQ
jgi:GTP-binding protein EngB required for normal cell division